MIIIFLCSSVRVVPCHFRDRRDVRRDASDRLVRPNYLAYPYAGAFSRRFHCRNVVKQDANPDHDQDVYIGRSEVAMWMRIVSSWICMLLYIWSLLAPVLMPDR